MIEAIQFSKSLQENCVIFAEISARENKGRSNFQITSTKLPYFWENFNYVFLEKILAPDNSGSLIFKSHQQNCFIFAKVWAHDKRGSANFQVTS